MTDSDLALQQCFEAIERAACEGARCPENGTLGVHSVYTAELARAGRIRVEISGHNWRTVEILAGPHTGKRTAPNPTGSKPFLIFDRNGKHRPGQAAPLDRGSRQQPSPPRPLDPAWADR